MRILHDLSVFSRHDAVLDGLEAGCRFYRAGRQPSRRQHVSRHDEQLERQSLYCCYLVESVLTDYYYQRRQNQHFLSLEYVYSGEMAIQNGARGLVAEAGELCLLHPGQDHALLYDSDRPCRKLGLILKGSLLPTLLTQLRLDRMEVIALPDSKPLEEIFAKIRQTLLQGLSPRACERNSGLTFELLQMIANVAQNRQLPQEVAEVLHYLEDHAERPLNMNDLAHRFSMSVPTLNKRFRESLQMTPYQVLIRLRMRRAAFLLLENKLAVKEIAILSGYGSPLHFSAEFHRFYGCAPRDYVKLNRF